MKDAPVLFALSSPLHKSLLELRLKDSRNRNKFLLVEIGWFLLGLCQYQWKPTLSRLMSAAILQVCLALDVPQPGFHFPIATPTRASPICPCVIAPDVYQQSNHLNLQHGGTSLPSFFAYYYSYNYPPSTLPQSHLSPHPDPPSSRLQPKSTPFSPLSAPVQAIPHEIPQIPGIPQATLVCLEHFSSFSPFTTSLLPNPDTDPQHLLNIHDQHPQYTQNSSLINPNPTSPLPDRPTDLLNPPPSHTPTCGFGPLSTPTVTSNVIQSLELFAYDLSEFVQDSYFSHYTYQDLHQAFKLYLQMYEICGPTLDSDDVNQLLHEIALFRYTYLNERFSGQYDISIDIEDEDIASHGNLDPNFSNNQQFNLQTPSTLSNPPNSINLPSPSPTPSTFPCKTHQSSNPPKNPSKREPIEVIEAFTHPLILYTFYSLPNNLLLYAKQRKIPRDLIQSVQKMPDGKYVACCDFQFGAMMNFHEYREAQQLAKRQKEQSYQNPTQIGPSAADSTYPSSPTLNLTLATGDESYYIGTSQINPENTPTNSTSSAISIPTGFPTFADIMNVTKYQEQLQSALQVQHAEHTLPCCKTDPCCKSHSHTPATPHSSTKITRSTAKTAQNHSPHISDLQPLKEFTNSFEKLLCYCGDRNIWRLGRLLTSLSYFCIQFENTSIHIIEHGFLRRQRAKQLLIQHQQQTQQQNAANTGRSGAKGDNLGPNATEVHRMHRGPNYCAPSNTDRGVQNGSDGNLLKIYQLGQSEKERLERKKKQQEAKKAQALLMKQQADGTNVGSDGGIVDNDANPEGNQYITNSPTPSLSTTSNAQNLIQNTNQPAITPQIVMVGGGGGGGGSQANSTNHNPNRPSLSLTQHKPVNPQPTHQLTNSGSFNQFQPSTQHQNAQNPHNSSNLANSNPNDTNSQSQSQSIINPIQPPHYPHSSPTTPKNPRNGNHTSPNHSSNHNLSTTTTTIINNHNDNNNVNNMNNPNSDLDDHPSSSSTITTADQPQNAHQIHNTQPNSPDFKVTFHHNQQHHQYRVSEPSLIDGNDNHNHQSSVSFHFSNPHTNSNANTNNLSTNNISINNTNTSRDPYQLNISTNTSNADINPVQSTNSHRLTTRSNQQINTSNNNNNNPRQQHHKDQNREGNILNSLNPNSNLTTNLNNSNLNNTTSQNNIQTPSNAQNNNNNNNNNSNSNSNTTTPRNLFDLPLRPNEQIYGTYNIFNDSENVPALPHTTSYHAYRLFTHLQNISKYVDPFLQNSQFSTSNDRTTVQTTTPIPPTVGTAANGSSNSSNLGISATNMNTNGLNSTNMPGTSSNPNLGPMTGITITNATDDTSATGRSAPNSQPIQSTALLSSTTRQNGPLTKKDQQQQQQQQSLLSLSSSVAANDRSISTAPYNQLTTTLSTSHSLIGDGVHGIPQNTPSRPILCSCCSMRLIEWSLSIQTSADYLSNGLQRCITSSPCNLSSTVLPTAIESAHLFILSIGLANLSLSSHLYPQNDIQYLPTYQFTQQLVEFITDLPSSSTSTQLSLSLINPSQTLNELQEIQRSNTLSANHNRISLCSTTIISSSNLAFHSPSSPLDQYSSTSLVSKTPTSMSINGEALSGVTKLTSTSITKLHNSFILPARWVEMAALASNLTDNTANIANPTDLDANSTNTIQIANPSTHPPLALLSTAQRLLSPSQLIKYRLLKAQDLSQFTQNPQTHPFSPQTQHQHNQYIVPFTMAPLPTSISQGQYQDLTNTSLLILSSSLHGLLQLRAVCPCASLNSILPAHSQHWSVNPIYHAVLQTCQRYMYRHFELVLNIIISFLMSIEAWVTNTALFAFITLVDELKVLVDDLYISQQQVARILALPDTELKQLVQRYDPIKSSFTPLLTHQAPTQTTQNQPQNRTPQSQSSSQPKSLSRDAVAPFCETVNANPFTIQHIVTKLPDFYFDTSIRTPYTPTKLCPYCSNPDSTQNVQNTQNTTTFSPTTSHNNTDTSDPTLTDNIVLSLAPSPLNTTTCAHCKFSQLYIPREKPKTQHDIKQYLTHLCYKFGLPDYITALDSIGDYLKDEYKSSDLDTDASSQSNPSGVKNRRNNGNHHASNLSQLFAITNITSPAHILYTTNSIAKSTPLGKPAQNRSLYSNPTPSSPFQPSLYISTLYQRIHHIYTQSQTQLEISSSISVQQQIELEVWIQHQFQTFHPNTQSVLLSFHHEHISYLQSLAKRITTVQEHLVLEHIIANWDVATTFREHWDVLCAILYFASGQKMLPLTAFTAPPSFKGGGGFQSNLPGQLNGAQKMRGGGISLSLTNLAQRSASNASSNVQNVGKSGLIVSDSTTNLHHNAAFSGANQTNPNTAQHDTMAGNTNTTNNTTGRFHNTSLTGLGATSSRPINPHGANLPSQAGHNQISQHAKYLANHHQQEHNGQLLEQPPQLQPPPSVTSQHHTPVKQVIFPHRLRTMTHRWRLALARCNEDVLYSIFNNNLTYSNPHNDYDSWRMIGHGAFGDVYSALECQHLVDHYIKEQQLQKNKKLVLRLQQKELNRQLQIHQQQQQQQQQQQNLGTLGTDKSSASVQRGNTPVVDGYGDNSRSMINAATTTHHLSQISTNHSSISNSIENPHQINTNESALGVSNDHHYVANPGFVRNQEEQPLYQQAQQIQNMTQFAHHQHHHHQPPTDSAPACPPLQTPSRGNNSANNVKLNPSTQNASNQTPNNPTNHKTATSHHNNNCHSNLTDSDEDDDMGLLYDPFSVQPAAPKPPLQQQPPLQQIQNNPPTPKKAVPQLLDSTPSIPKPSSPLQTTPTALVDVTAQQHAVIEQHKKAKQAQKDKEKEKYGENSGFFSWFPWFGSKSPDPQQPQLGQQDKLKQKQQQSQQQKQQRSRLTVTLDSQSLSLASTSLPSQLARLSRSNPESAEFTATLTASDLQPSDNDDDDDGDEEICPRQVAIKQMSISTHQGLVAGMRETQTMRLCINHPNIITLYQSYHFDQFLWLVMQYCDGGTLGELTSQQHLSESLIAYIVKEILQGLVWLHSKSRIHRDLKPANILLNHDGTVHIADLGLCLEYEQHSITTSLAGTENYISPEMIRNEGYDSATDIWSLGCCLIEMCNKRPPMKHLSTFSVLYRTVMCEEPHLYEFQHESGIRIDPFKPFRKKYSEPIYTTNGEFAAQNQAADQQGQDQSAGFFRQLTGLGGTQSNSNQPPVPISPDHSDPVVGPVSIISGDLLELNNDLISGAIIEEAVSLFIPSLPHPSIDNSPNPPTRGKTYKFNNAPEMVTSTKRLGDLMNQNPNPPQSAATHPSATSTSTTNPSGADILDPILQPKQDLFETDSSSTPLIVDITHHVIPPTSSLHNNHTLENVIFQLPHTHQHSLSYYELKSQLYQQYMERRVLFQLQNFPYQQVPAHLTPLPTSTLSPIANRSFPAFSPPYQSCWSPLLRDFLNLCFTKDHRYRPTAEELLQHPFVCSAPTSSHKRSSNKPHDIHHYHHDNHNHNHNPDNAHIVGTAEDLQHLFYDVYLNDTLQSAGIL